jgi:hypothetical protein
MIIYHYWRTEFFNLFRELEEDYEDNPDAWETEPPPPPYASLHGGSGSITLDFDDSDFPAGALVGLQC